MKKFLSTILAVVMVLGSMATVAFADGETATGTIKVNDVEYPSISAAEAAAGVGGTINISGTIYLSSREGIETDGLKLVGDGTAVITTADNFSAASDKNRKSVLNVTGEGVTIENITFDGGTYGANLVPKWNDEATEFNVVRINSGSATLKNVTIKNSTRTLLSIGTENDEAEVTAEGLYCEASYKAIPLNWLGVTYADVNVVHGKLILKSGKVNGYIAEDYSILPRYSGELDNQTTNHYRLKYVYNTRKDLISTVDHFVNSYANASENAQSYVSGYVNTAAYAENATTIGLMVAEAKTSGNATLKANFIELLTDAVNASNNDTVKTTLNGYINELK